MHDHERDLETRLAEIAARADAGDRRTIDALAQLGTALGNGAAVLINVFNPQVVLLGGYFAVLGRFFMEPMAAELRARVFGPDLAGVTQLDERFDRRELAIEVESLSDLVDEAVAAGAAEQGAALGENLAGEPGDFFRQAGPVELLGRQADEAALVQLEPARARLG